MANTLNAVTPKLLAMGLLALREICVMPRLVNRGYEDMAGQKGSTIDVPIPSSVAVQDVTPANVPPSTSDVAPTSVPIVLDQWKEAPFYLTDKDVLTAMDGVMPMQASEAIKAVANYVDQYLLALARKFYGYTGTAGTTPFASDTSDATNVRKILNKQLAPMDPRHLVFDPDSEANALNLRAFQDASWVGSVDAIIAAKLNQRLGFNFWMSQNVQTHTKGTATTITLTSTSAVGDGSVLLKASGAGTLVDGDVITIAGDTTTYVVETGGATLAPTVSGGIGTAFGAVTGSVSLSTSAATVYLYPKIKVAVDGSSSPVAVTLKGTHVMNAGFHRDAIAFATRPLEAAVEGLGNIIMAKTDPVSGLTLRLEISREHKRTRYSYDILFGASVVRRELGCRLAG